MNDKDRWSAHLEYLKVAITLATALLAVAAAVYSDPSKIPSGGTKYILLTAAVFVFLTLVSSITGVIFLSNYLIRENQNAPDAVRARRITISSGFSFYLLMFSGLFIVIFFSVRAVGEEPSVPPPAQAIQWIDKKGEAPDLAPLTPRVAELTTRVAKLEDRLEHLRMPVPPDVGPLTARVTKLEDRLDRLLCPSTEAELTVDQKRQIQQSLGFSGHQVDGIFGANTRRAIAALRRSRNLPTTGNVTEGEIKELLPSCKL